MLKYLPLFLLLAFFTNCSDDGAASDVKFKIATGIVINENIPDLRTVIDAEGNTSVELFEIVGPSARITFDIQNNHDQVITIISARFEITGPDGTIRTRSLFLEDAFGVSLGFFAILRPEKDINCDGVVDKTEKNIKNPELDDCGYDNQNPSFLGSVAYLENLLDGLDDTAKALHKNSSYNVALSLSGWIGDLNNPEDNFSKEVNFSVSSN